MRTLLIAASCGILWLTTSPGIAADMALPRHKEVVAPEKIAANEIACVRWVEQNYSWYNYCDPVPNYGRRKYY
jgi:hypothetical protein